MARPSVRPANTQLSLLADIVAMDQKDDPEIGHPPLITAMCTLPGKKPPDELRVWSRENDKARLTITAGTNLQDGSNIGLPYGPKARLLLAVIGAHVMKHGDPVIDLGPSMAKFMNSLGLGTSGGRTGPRNLVGEQIRRLVRSQLEVSWDRDNTLERDRGAGMRFARSWDVWWDRSENPTHPVKGSYIELSPDFFQLIKDHSFPVNVDALRILDSKGALAMDLYSWLTFRLRKVERPTLVSWAQLTQQFGKAELPDAGRARSNAISETKRNIKNVIGDVLAVYHCAKVDISEGGLRLHHSPPHVPKRGQHGIARARAEASLPMRRLAAAAADAAKIPAQGLGTRGHRPGPVEVAGGPGHQS